MTYLLLAAGGAVASGVGITITDGGIGTAVTVAWMAWVSKTLVKVSKRLDVVYRRLGIRGG